VPRRCTLCVHPEREAIDARIVGGEAARLLAAVYGVSDRALRRHAANHLPAALADAQSAKAATKADDLLGKVAQLEADAQRLGRTAEAAGDLRTALGAVRELVRIVELLARLRGELDDRAQVTVNVLASAEWLAVRDAVFGALTAYPEARAVVSSRLLELEAGP